MTSSLSRTSRLSIFASALVYTGLMLGTAIAPAPLAAAQSGPYYSASLAQSTDEDRAVAGGVAWACKDTECVANKGTSRPVNVCRGLARKFGEITSFTAKGKELSDDKLAKCNGN
ncbi:hypothetical protein FGU71_07335 [Erythrobacter insulae]|uniref:Uncharacterized protein n=1 Tax=Erythrobacter insulae TaxID=2584124 RepID=A0A547PC32_9SPHN|nr:hypothetical protein [Erythrobacter insulae]TRD11698.1 hypothetical protein FGU71_07335 [Erythrobacter insulae]